MIGRLKNPHLVHLLYLSSLLLSLHYAFVVYINSSFLTQYFTPKSVGLLYTLGAVVNIVFFLVIAKVLKRTGNYRLTIGLIILELLLILLLTLLKTPALVASVFILHHAIIPLIAFDLDIFLESFTSDKETGTVRGIFLTSTNLALVLSPFVSGRLAEAGGFTHIYLASTLFLLPLFFVIATNLRTFGDAPYRALNVRSAVQSILSNRNLRNIFLANFILQFFYSWMVIYTPLFLQQEIGFNLSETLTIFSIMLLPFLLLQIPLGRLADKKTGEQELLMAGFLITAFSTMLLSFITVQNFFIWAAALFTTRIGASAVEIMSESYFFKQIAIRDAEIISFFRMSRPIAYVIGPLSAGALITFLSTTSPENSRFLFIALGALMLFGLIPSLRIKDTK